MRIYYGVTAVATVLCGVIFRDYLNVDISSVIPLIVFALLVLWSSFYNRESSNVTKEDTSYTVGGERFSGKERAALYSYLSISFRCVAPLCVPFVFFFSSQIKTLSLALYFVAIIFARLLFGKKHGNEIKNRIKKEQQELSNQLKKEEEGKIK